MVDLSNKRSDPDGVTSEESQGSEIKRCADCGTSKTPLWRGGPAGPKSLCNACGIRSRKKRRAILGLKTEEKKLKRSGSGNSSASCTTTTSSTKSSKFGGGGGTTLHQRLIALGREVMMQRSRVDNKPRKMKLGEEEQAAVLLMALSYGSVYA